MRDSLSSLDRAQPRAVTRQSPAVEAWAAEHVRLERELARAAAELAAARSALQQAIADATTTAAAAAAAQPPPPPPEHVERRRDRMWRWLRRQPAPDAFWNMPAPDDHAERLAASARARVRALRDELARSNVDHQAVSERIAEHTARLGAAERLDDARHADELELARNEHERRQSPQRARVNGWLRVLPTRTRKPAR